MGRRRNLEFALLAVFSLVFWWNPLTKTFRLAGTNEAYTHIILILPLSLALIYFESKTKGTAMNPNRLAGFLLLVVCLALGVCARTSGIFAPDVQLTLSMLALVIWWVACVVCCFGVSAFRALLFPLGFLLWLVPLPDSLLNWIIVVLQNGTAEMARWLFQLARVPVTLNGVTLSLPGIDIEVARECSSIRSSMVLVITSMVLTHLFLRSPWRKMFVVLVAIPLSIAKNALRIFVIVGLAIRADPGYLDGNLHHRGGIVFLIVALAVTGALLWLLARSEAGSRTSLMADRARNP
jgi:exosortase